MSYTPRHFHCSFSDIRTVFSDNLMCICRRVIDNRTLEQVTEGAEYKLLMELKTSELKDNQTRQKFYQKVIQSLDMGESSYLLLMASDCYDVPRKSSDVMRSSDSDEVFSYFLCAVCPVKTEKTELGYFSGDNEFHCSANQVVVAPELGFLFPAFDDRSANIYNALFYSRKADELHAFA